MPSCAGIKTEARAEKIFVLTFLKKILLSTEKCPRSKLCGFAIGGMM